MHLHTHFEELQYRFFYVITTWLTSFIVSYCYRDIATFTVMKPIFMLYNTEICYFITTNIVEIFYINLQVASFVAGQITFVIVVYNFLSFLTPGLYKHESDTIKTIIKMICVLWLIMIMLLHKYVLPNIWNFFIDSGKEGSYTYFEGKLSEYVEFYLHTYFITGACGAFIIIMVLYLKLCCGGVWETKKFRRMSLLGVFLVATIVTPPDVCSQLLVAGTLSTLIEILITIVLYNNLR